MRNVLHYFGEVLGAVFIAPAHMYVSDSEEKVYVIYPGLPREGYFWDVASLEPPSFHVRLPYSAASYYFGALHSPGGHWWSAAEAQVLKDLTLQL